MVGEGGGGWGGRRSAGSLRTGAGGARCPGSQRLRVQERKRVGWRGAEDPKAAVSSSEWSAWSGVGAQPQSEARSKHTSAHWPSVQVTVVCPPCPRSFCPSIHPQASSLLGSRDRSWGREPAPAGTEAGVRAGSRACEEVRRSHPRSLWADGPVPRGPSPCSSSFSHTRVSSWPLSSQRKGGISEARRGLPVRPCLPPPRWPAGVFRPGLTASQYVL